MLLFSTLLASMAGAAPLDQKKAEAARLQRQLEAEGQRVSVLAEQYNSARLKVEAARTAADKAGSQLAQANAQFATIRDRMARHAIESYMHGGGTTTIEHLLRGTGDDVIARRQYLDAAAADGRKAIDDLRAAREDLAAIRARHQALQADAQATALDLASKKSAADRAVAANRATLAKVTGELADLIRQDEARKAADAARRVQDALNSGKGKLPGLLKSTRPAPPVPRGALGAVEAARQQLGKPYVYGGSGPDTFDCSGLVMYVWGRAGVSLPHSATAQYYATTHIAISELQPGDIVFFGSDLHHDGLYVGGGQMIEAPHSGEVVRYASIFRSDLVGAGRVNQ